MKEKHTLFHYFLVVLAALIKSVALMSIWTVLAGAGYLVFQTKISPYNLIIGLPLLLAGIGMALNNLWSLILAIFSPKYNRGVCRLCP